MKSYDYHTNLVKSIFLRNDNRLLGIKKNSYCNMTNISRSTTIGVIGNYQYCIYYKSFYYIYICTGNIWKIKY